METILHNPEISLRFCLRRETFGRCTLKKVGVVLAKYKGAQGKACLASDFEEMEFSGIVPVQTVIDQKQPQNVEQ